MEVPPQGFKLGSQGEEKKDLEALSFALEPISPVPPGMTDSGCLIDLRAPRLNHSNSSINVCVCVCERQ